MTAKDFEVASGDVRVRVSGLSRTVRQLSRAGADAGDLKDLMHRVGTLVVRAANPPVLSGALSGTVRAGKGKTKAVVRAGGARTPYAGVIHYGWPARNIRPQPFLVEALNRERSDVLQALDQGITALLKQHDLI